MDKSQITRGNAGDWSEPYVLLSLLSEGRIYDADGDLNIIKDVWHDISSIIFKQDSSDKKGSLKYEINPDCMTVDVYLDGNHLIQITRNECSEYAEGLRNTIINSHYTNRTIDVDQEYSDFLLKIGRKKLTASFKDIPDIWLEMPDVRNTTNKPLGFSIKSRLSKHLPTIFNSSGASNIIYEITGDVTPEKINKLTSLCSLHTPTKSEPKTFDYPDYPSRIKLFKEMGLGLEYKFARTIDKFDDGSIHITDDDPFEKSLRMIDSNMPQILADMTADAYLNGIKYIWQLVSILNAKDRFGVKPDLDYPFYEKKVQDMLVAMATSMTAAKIWDGREGTNGGFIIVKENGDVVCYHIFDRNDFREFLLQNMKFESPDNSRHYSMGIEEKDGRYYLSLNVQIRMGNKKIKNVSHKTYYDYNKGVYLDSNPIKTEEIHFRQTTL